MKAQCGREPLGTTLLLASLGLGMLISSAVKKQQCLLLTSWESPDLRQRNFFALSYNPPDSCAHLNIGVWHGSCCLWAGGRKTRESGV